MKIAMLAHNPKLYTHKRLLKVAQARGQGSCGGNTVLYVFASIMRHVAKDRQLDAEFG